MEVLQDLPQGVNIGGGRELIGLGGHLFGGAVVTGVAQVVEEAFAPAEAQVDELDLLVFMGNEDVAGLQV